jgi:hypothetical protein
MMGILRKILGAPNALLRTVAEKLLIGRIRDAAAGKYGPGWQKVYDAAKGVKSKTGLGLGLAGFVLSAMGMSTEANYVFGAGGFLLAVGLADKATNAPGRPEILSNSALYRFLADNSGTIATVLGSAYTYVKSEGCTSYMVHGYAVTCDVQANALAALAFALVYVGILDHGLTSQTPAAVKAAAASKEG